jgi:hypothetical protein
VLLPEARDAILATMVLTRSEREPKPIQPTFRQLTIAAYVTTLRPLPVPLLITKESSTTVLHVTMAVPLLENTTIMCQPMVIALNAIKLRASSLQRLIMLASSITASHVMMAYWPSVKETQSIILRPTRIVVYAITPQDLFLQHLITLAS